MGAGYTLSAMGNLIICLLKHNISDTFTLNLIEEMLCFSSLHEHSQEWEEAVTQSASYVLNNIMKKSEKDKEKLATITDQDVLSHINRKKFLKQLRIILEKMFSDAIGHEPETAERVKEEITRVEELVEVI